MRQRSRSYRDRDEDEGAVGEDLAAVNDRLDALTRQLERMALANAPVHAAAGDERADRVSEALARLDRRLDQVIADGRGTAGVFHQTRHQPVQAPQHPAPPQYQPVPAQYYAPQPMRQQQPPQQYAAPPAPVMPPPAPTVPGPVNWAAQISARQRALEGGLAAPQAPSHPAPVARPTPVPIPMPQEASQGVPHAMSHPPAGWAAPDMSGVEQQLLHINTQISALHQPYENALAALRGDLAEIGRALNDALPRHAIEALETEVRALAERVDRTRQAGADGAALAALERELVEVRNALRGLTPAENLGGFEEAVRGLYHKIDQIAASGAAAQGDPLAFKQLEQAVVSLRGVVSNVASDGALAQLSAEVRGLAAQFERASAESSGEALGRLETRIAALMESGRAVPPELEGSIRDLSERLDRMQLSQGDQVALVALEDRIAKLSEKLDASDSRLSHLEAVERGLADLLVHLEEMKSTGRTLRAPAEVPMAPPPAPMRPEPAMPPPMAAAPPIQPAAFAGSPLDLIPDMPAPQHAPSVAPLPPAPVPILAPIPAPMPTPMPQARPESFAPSAPAPSPAPVAPPMRQMPRGPQRQPIDPNLPPDTPLEPGSGVPRVRPGSAAARIAASEAALGHVRPMTPETGGKAAAIAAARNAVKAAYLDTPVKVPKSFSPPRIPLKWPFKKKPAPLAIDQPIEGPPMPGAAAKPVPMMPAAMLPMTSGPAPDMALPIDDSFADSQPSRRQRMLKFGKTMLIAASVAVIVVGTAQTAMEFLFPDQPGTAPVALSKDQSQSPPEAPPRSRAPGTTPSRPMPAAGGGVTAPPDTGPEKTDSIGGKSIFDPSTIIKLPDITGSIPHKTVAPKIPSADPAANANIALPASIGPVLRTAVLANAPAAEYEMGARYAEGRGVPQNMPEAVRWLQRASDAGFAPAQFRLASLSEKGDGLKKDLQAARRLYLAAAAQGHAKSMHNLAVLYAEGIDGKPDYKAAAQWFRKAADYGVTDSQFNLAILYARGIGVAVDLAASYRWFSLAAAHGDTDATKKRDEVAARLDAKALAMARQAVQAFVPDQEPAAATDLKIPPGGWDHTPAATAKARR